MSNPTQVFIDIQNASSTESIPTPEEFHEWIKAAVNTEPQIAELCVRIVDKEDITELNKNYRQKDKPTNVLAFPAQIPESVSLNILGDIIICAEVVETEAKAQNKPVINHWAHLIIHATLHLLGYDHLEDEQAKQMEALETKLMQELDLPDPYASEKEFIHD